MVKEMIEEDLYLSKIELKKMISKKIEYLLQATMAWWAVQ